LPKIACTSFGSNGSVLQIETNEPKQVVQVTGKFLVSSDPALTGEITLYLNGSAFPLAAVTDNQDRFRTVLTGNLIRKDTSDIKERIINKDNGSNGTGREQDPVAFVFVPKTNLAVVSGKFDGAGTTGS